MTDATIRSKAGGLLKLPVPDVDQINIEDVAHALSNVCRCAGHTTPFFSVLHHSMEVATLSVFRAQQLRLPDAKLAGYAGLLHDAPEYVVGDVISPLKRRLGEAYRSIYREVESRVYEAFGLSDLPHEYEEVVKWADLQMLVSDMIRWKVHGNIVDSNGDVHRIEPDAPPPKGFKVWFRDTKPYAAGEGREEFLAMFNDLRR